MKKIILLLASLVIVGELNAQRWQWVKTYNAKYWGNDRVYPDQAGNLYLAGKLHDSISFDQNKIIRTRDSALYITKLDRDGNCIWLKKYPGCHFHTMYVDRFSSSVYLLWADSIVNGYGYSSGPVPTNHFAKLDSSGKLVWQMSIKGAWSSFSYADFIQTDPGGNVYIKGRFGDSLSMGGQTITNSHITSTYITKVTSYGTVVWLKKYGFELNGTRNTVVTQGKIATLAVDSLIILDTAGNHAGSQEIITCGQNYSPFRSSLAADELGNIYIGMSFYDTVCVGSFSFADVAPCHQFWGGCHDILVFKMDLSGNVDWARHLYSHSSDELSEIVATGINNIHAIGHNRNDLHIEDSVYSKQNTVFVTSFAKKGVHKGAAFSDNANGTIQSGVNSASGIDNMLFVSGSINTHGWFVVFGDDTLRAYQGNFVGRLDIDDTNIPVEEYSLRSGALSVNPNPTTSLLFLRLTDAKKPIKSCHIYDLTGRLMNAEFDLSGGPEARVDMAGNSSGMYLLEVSDGEQLYFQKFILE